MSLKIYLYTTLIACIISVIAGFFDYTISLGIMIATLFSMFNLYMLSASMKSMMDKKDVSGYSMLLTINFIRFGLLGLLIYVVIKNPKLFNIFGVVIGLTLFMVALLIDAIRKRGK